MTNDRVADLLRRLRKGNCTDEEIDELNAWFHNLKGGRADFEAWVQEAGGDVHLSRNDEDQKRVIYEPVKLAQDFRSFDFLSPWEGMRHILPGDEKADATAKKPGA